MDSHELSEWVAFDAVEPIGGLRGDINAALICTLLANINRKRGSKALKVEDFLLFRPDDPEDKLQQQGDAFIAWAKAWNAQQARKPT